MGPRPGAPVPAVRDGAQVSRHPRVHRYKHGRHGLGTGSKIIASENGCANPLQTPYRVLVDFAALVSSAQRDGWASGKGDISLVRKQAASLGWAEVAVRRSDPPVAVLRPTDKAAAHPRSPSAQYGLGQQPLHTDGAHLADPPDVVVLASAHPSPTPTLLWTAIIGPGPISSRTAVVAPGMSVSDALAHVM
jgi:hypothetical protein